MELSVKERIMAFNVLPNTGGYTDLIIIKDAKQKVGLTQKEIKDWEVTSSDEQGVSWNSKKAKEVEINFTEAELKQIKDGFKKLDTEKKLSLDAIDVYKKFM